MLSQEGIDRYEKHKKSAKTNTKDPVKITKSNITQPPYTSNPSLAANKKACNRNGYRVFLFSSLLKRHDKIDIIETKNAIDNITATIMLAGIEIEEYANRFNVHRENVLAGLYDENESDFVLLLNGPVDVDNYAEMRKLFNKYYEENNWFSNNFVKS